MSALTRAATAASLFCLLTGDAHAVPSMDAALVYPDSISALPPASEVDLVLPAQDAAVEPAACDSCCGGCDDDCCADACCGDSCCGDSCTCGLGCACPPTWIVKAGAVILTRNRPSNNAIVVPLAGPGVISSGSEFGFDYAGGPDVSIARRTARGNYVEVRYFGALDWDSSAAYGGVGNVRIGSFSNFGATALTSRYETTLHSTEINWLVPRTDRVTLLSGFRWIELQDDLVYRITFPQFSADYNWNANNHLYGGQLGANLNLWNLTGPFTVNAAMKGGVYGNVADNDFTLRPSTGGVFDGGRSRNPVSFVGEINVTSAYRITNHMALRGGYQLLWLDHVALASDQGAASTAASSQAVIDTRGNAFFHGAMTSVDFTW